jgi:hypothetical protein
LTHKDARVHCVVLKIRAEPHHLRRQPPAPNTQRPQLVRRQARPAQKNPAPNARDPSGPNNVPDTTPPNRPRSTTTPQREKQVLARPPELQRQIIDDPPMSNPHDTNGRGRLPGHPYRTTHHDGQAARDASAP